MWNGHRQTDICTHAISGLLWSKYGARGLWVSQVNSFLTLMDVICVCEMREWHWCQIKRTNAVKSRVMCYAPADVSSTSILVLSLCCGFIDFYVVGAPHGCGGKRLCESGWSCNQNVTNVIFCIRWSMVSSFSYLYFMFIDT